MHSACFVMLLLILQILLHAVITLADQGSRKKIVYSSIICIFIAWNPDNENVGVPSTNKLTKNKLNRK